MHADEARLEGVGRREEEAAARQAELDAEQRRQQDEAAARRAELDAEQRRLQDEAASLGALREALEAERVAAAAEAQVPTQSCISGKFCS